jgi:hypothetical protein
MMVERQQQRMGNPSAAEKSRRLGWKYGAGVAIATASVVAAMLFQRCGGEPKTETIIQDCPPVKACPAPPKKGDNKCELDKGEHDPWAKDSKGESVFDVESCGYCGDGIQQEHETAEECPIDFECGNGKVQYRGKDFGAVVEVEQDDQTLLYTVGIVKYSETCQETGEKQTDTQLVKYCEEDCPTRPGRARKREPREPGVGTPAPKPTRKAGAPCESTVRQNAQQVYTRVASQVSSASGSIKSGLGASGVVVRVSVPVTVSSSGALSVGRASARCGEEKTACPGSANINSLAGINVGGITVANGGPSCVLSVPVKLR